ncbi:T7SS effector LXG polymorphic toxin, partial [Paraliobacillus sp. JSM ZJ581]|uniref:T7SS effector LXG polymorphic toxin n=1 Tax=Paraliobacillus sp. JSM ZJ581 TaxID=3342118 RepID=UPI0035A9272F
MDKVLDASSLLGTMKERMMHYEQMKEQLEALYKSVEDIISFDDFKGKGAESVK